MSEHRYSKITQQNYTTVQNTKFATYAAPYTCTKYNKKQSVSDNVEMIAHYEALSPFFIGLLLCHLCCWTSDARVE